MGEPFSADLFLLASQGRMSDNTWSEKDLVTKSTYEVAG
jgi:hypothetical protein